MKPQQPQPRPLQNRTHCILTEPLQRQRNNNRSHNHSLKVKPQLTQHDVAKDTSSTRLLSFHQPQPGTTKRHPLPLQMTSTPVLPPPCPTHTPTPRMHLCRAPQFLGVRTRRWTIFSHPRCTDVRLCRPLWLQQVELFLAS